MRLPSATQRSAASPAPGREQRAAEGAATGRVSDLPRPGTPGTMQPRAALPDLAAVAARA